MLFNIYLGNHKITADNLGGMAKLAEYMEWVLSKSGHEVLISLHEFNGDGINLVFEHFTDESISDGIISIKRKHGVKIGIIATELIVGKRIPYARSGLTASEQESSNRVRLFDQMARELDFVWCFLQRTAVDYANKSKICHFFPVGSIKDQVPAYLSPPRNIDVFFFGRKTPFRAAIIESIEKLGISVVSFGLGFSNGMLDEFWLKNILLRTKIGLSLSFEKYHGSKHGVDPRFASCLRVKQMLDSGVCVVSETIPLDNPYAPYMVSCPPEKIAAQVKELLTSGQWESTGRTFSEKFQTDMSAVDLCRPIIDSTIQALAS